MRCQGLDRDKCRCSHREDADWQEGGCLKRHTCVPESCSFPSGRAEWSQSFENNLYVICNLSVSRGQLSEGSGGRGQGDLHKTGMVTPVSTPRPPLPLCPNLECSPKDPLRIVGRPPKEPRPMEHNCAHSSTPSLRVPREQGPSAQCSIPRSRMEPRRLGECINKPLKPAPRSEKSAVIMGWAETSSAFNNKFKASPGER